MRAEDILSGSEKTLIMEAIREAETNTSGEIRVHVEDHCPIPKVFDRATEVFSILGMHKTAERNGVLFYLALKDHQFSILGDEGINTKVPANFWEEIKDHMQKQFRDHNFTEGLCEGILMAGQQLKHHFPYKRDDRNELPNDISFGGKHA
jgi:uncharacterized membrane protein